MTSLEASIHYAVKIIFLMVHAFCQVKCLALSRHEQHKLFAQSWSFTRMRIRLGKAIGVILGLLGDIRMKRFHFIRNLIWLAATFCQKGALVNMRPGGCFGDERSLSVLVAWADPLLMSSLERHWLA
jgi:hypothetical protein